MFTVYDWNWATPVALPGYSPVPQAIINLATTNTQSFDMIGNTLKGRIIIKTAKRP